MRRMFRKTAVKIFCIVLAALLAGSAIAAFSHNGSSPLTTVTGIVFTPAQRLAAAVARGLGALPFSFRSSSVLTRELDDLKAKNSDLQKQLVDYEKLKKQNDLYRNFLGLKEEHPDQTYCEAAVIGRDAADYICSFILNKGSAAGIAVQDPVIYGNHLVGKVIAVTPTQCTVQTLLDPNFNVSCSEIRTGTLGYVTTTVDLSARGLCQMPNLPGDTAITEGGTVCTSGVGNVFPADLIIGTITKIVDATVDISAAAVIEPGVDFSTLTGVFVITDFQGQSE